MGVLDAHHARVHLQDSPRSVAELKDIARHALDREIFVDRANERLGRLQDDAVIGIIRDGASRGQRR